MPKLFYLSLVRYPTEKAHGLQITQNCEAFARASYEVVLWVSTRKNTPQMDVVEDVYAHYGVERNFTIRRIPSLDLMPLSFGKLLLERIAFYVHIISYAIAMVWLVRGDSADVYYSRDEHLLLVLSWFKPKHKLAYEAHLYSPTARGKRLQSAVVKRVGSVIAVTPKLREELIALGADPERSIVRHDGIRAERFQNLPNQTQARAEIGWEDAGYVVGYMGRLQTMNLDKGVGTLIQAIAQVGSIQLALVGGPDDLAEEYRQQWLRLGLPATAFLYAGQVAPDEVPTYLRAFDVCAMPFPFTEKFAYYASPLKLFEYMASGRAVIASDLPAFADVVTDQENVFLVPPSDVDALASAIRVLRDDRELRDHLATHAQQHALANYTWQQRAMDIVKHIESAERIH